MSGKGSTPRPFSVSADEYGSRWDQIFRKDAGAKDGPTFEAKPNGSLNIVEADNGSAGQPDKEGSGPAEGLG